jgi:hypothetical protein
VDLVLNPFFWLLPMKKVLAALSINLFLAIPSVAQSPQRIAENPESAYRVGRIMGLYICDVATNLRSGDTFIIVFAEAVARYQKDTELKFPGVLDAIVDLDDNHPSVSAHYTGMYEVINQECPQVKDLPQFR